MTLTGATYGVTVNRQVESGATANLTIASEGAVSITGDTAAVRFDAVQNSAEMNGNITGASIELKSSEGTGLQATNASMALNSTDVTIGGATGINANNSNLSVGLADEALSLKVTGNVWKWDAVSES